MQPSSKLKPLNTHGRMKLFGRFSYKAVPLPDNPENIEVTGNWVKENLVTIPLGALEPAKGADSALFHRLVAPRVEELIAAWEAAGVAEDVCTWNGSYCARFIRGTTLGTLSAHAWGSAFDLNAKWNRLGAIPAAEGETGSVLRLVPIAERHGFYWGGRFARCDAMHFELARL